MGLVMGDILPGRNQVALFAAGAAAIGGIATWHRAVHQVHAHTAEVLAVARDALAAVLAAAAVLVLLAVARWLSGREGWHCEAGAPRPEPRPEPAPAYRAARSGEPRVSGYRLRPEAPHAGKPDLTGDRR
jgi:hypothetical protein